MSTIGHLNRSRALSFCVAGAIGGALLGTGAAFGQTAPPAPAPAGSGQPAAAVESAQPAASASAPGAGSVPVGIAPAQPPAVAAPQRPPLWPGPVAPPPLGPVPPNPLGAGGDRQVTGQTLAELGLPKPGQPGMQAPVQLGGPQPGPARGRFPRLDTHVDLHNLFLYRSDSDFDRTRPAYDRTGQSVGAFATVFRPKLTFHIHPRLRLYYEAELGLNFWSRNNPDQQAAPMADAFVLKHREVYSEGEFLRGTTGFKAGYQFFRDTTGLFVGHWIGAASLWYAWNPASRASVFVGQIPDQTYEGLGVGDPGVMRNNFKNDIFVFGPRADLKLGENAAFAAAVHVLYDGHTIGQPLWLLAPNMQLDGRSGPWAGFVGAVVQVGQHENAGVGGQSQNVLAWAAQAHGNVHLRRADLAVNLLALSPDDQAEGNSRNGAFRYSSKSRSATIILTEDEVRNWYDQLDRRMGRYEGGFWTHRAGLFVGDIKGTWEVTSVFRPALVVGAATVLNKKNAMDKAFVGLETDVNLEFRASENLAANLVAGILFPGAAGGALLNKVSLASTDPIWMLQGSLLARY